MGLYQTFAPATRTAAVPTRNVNLTAKLDRFVKKSKGRTLRQRQRSRPRRLRTLQREEREFDAKLAALRAAIDDADASGIARGNVFARVRKSLKLSARALAVGALLFSRRAESDLLNIANYNLRTWGKAQTVRIWPFQPQHNPVVDQVANCAAPSKPGKGIAT
jgi:hypothetical protein